MFTSRIFTAVSHKIPQKALLTELWKPLSFMNTPFIYI